MRLNGKVSVVAGVGTGIGRATALLFAQEGSKVALIARRKEVALETADKINNNGGLASAYSSDLTQAFAAEDTLKKVHQTYGKIDILHCNMGAFSLSPFEKMTETNWDDMFNVNLKSIFLTVRACAPYMTENKTGSIILTAAVYGLGLTPPNMSHYNASKAGVIALTKSLALEFAPHQIRVNAVCPGTISHQIYTQGNKNLTTEKKLERKGHPEDIAFGVLYLASDESSWVTGTTMVIDGGASVGIAGA